MVKRMRFDELVEAQENHGISKIIVDYTIQNEHTERLVEHLTNSMRGNFFAKSLRRSLKAATYQERRVWLEAREWDDYADDKEANFLPVASDSSDESVVEVPALCLSELLGSSSSPQKSPGAEERH